VNKAPQDPEGKWETLEKMVPKVNLVKMDLMDKKETPEASDLVDKLG